MLPEPKPEDFQMLNMLLNFQPVGEVTTHAQALQTIEALNAMAVTCNAMVHAWVDARDSLDNHLMKEGEFPNILVVSALQEMSIISSVWQNQAALVLDHDLGVMQAYMDQFGGDDAQRPE